VRDCRQCRIASSMLTTGLKTELAPVFAVGFVSIHVPLGASASRCRAPGGRFESCTKDSLHCTEAAHSAASSRAPGARPLPVQPTDRTGSATRRNDRLEIMASGSPYLAVNRGWAVVMIPRETVPQGARFVRSGSGGTNPDRGGRVTGGGASGSPLHPLETSRLAPSAAASIVYPSLASARVFLGSTMRECKQRPPQTQRRIML